MRRKRKTKKYFLLFLFFLVFIGLFWAVFISDFLSIQEVRIREEGKKEKIVPRESFFGQGNKILNVSHNIFFLNTDYLKKRFNDPTISKIDVFKDYKNRRIILEIKKRKEKIIWCFAGHSEEIKKCFSVDEEGVAFKDSAFIIGLKKPLVVQYLTTSSLFFKNKNILGLNIVLPEKINFILKVYKRLFPFFEKINFKIMPDDEEKLIVNNGKFDIFFNFQENYSSQLNAFEEVNNKLKKENLKPTYIDLQSLPRVYYK